MFMDDKLADFSQKVGQASLGASDEDILKLATVGITSHTSQEILQISRDPTLD